MSNKYHAVNQKLQHSSDNLDKVMKSILPEEKPLAGPQFYSNDSKNIKRFQKVMENPEDNFNQTIKNNQALTQFLGGLIA